MGPLLLIFLSPLLFFSSGAHAGQLIVDDYGLKEVAAGDGFVYAATLTKIAAKDRVLVELTRVWVAPDKTAPKLQAGAVVELAIYTGVVWTNPNKSPLDERLRGGVSAKSFKSGDALLAVPAQRGADKFELLPASAANLAKLSVFFSADGRAAYASAEASRLIADLRDPDLAALALAAATARSDVPRSEAIHADQQALLPYYESLGEAARREFLRALVVPAAKDPAIRNHVLSLASRKIVFFPIAELAPFAEMVDPASKEDERWVRDFRISLLSLLHARPCEPGEFSPLDKYFVRAAKHRPSHASRDEDLSAKFLPCMDTASRGRTAVGLLATVHDTTHSRGEIDLFLLATAVVLARDALPADLLPVLAKVDPMVTRTWGTQKTIFGALLEIAVAHKSAPAMKKVIEPHLYFGTPAEKEDLAAYHAAFGALSPRPAPAALSTTLSPGERLLTPDGTRVALDRQLNVSVYSKLNFGNISHMDASPWSVEWEVEPYRAKVSRVAETPPRVKVELTPL